MKKLIYGASVAALLLSATLSFVSCDDYVQDQLTEIRGISSGNATLVEALDTKLNNLDQKLDTQISGLRTELTGYAAAMISDLTVEAQDMAADLYSYIDGKCDYFENKNLEIWNYVNSQDSVLFHNLTEYITDIADFISGRVDSLSTEMAAYKLFVYGEFVSMKAYVDSLNGSMKEYVDSQDAATNARVDSIIGLLGQVEIQEANFAALAQMKMDENGSIILGKELQDAIIATVNTYTKAETDSLFAANSADILAQVSEINVKTMAVVDSLIGIVSKDIDDLETTVGELKAKVISALFLLQSEIDEVKGDVAKLNTEVEKMKKNYEKQITSIVLQGTYNNVFGSIRLPMGLNSMLLAGHYGQIINDIKLPKADGILTAEDLTAIGHQPETLAEAGDRIVEGAGYAYVTINPNTAKLDGVKFDIVNSLDETNGFAVGTPVKCNEKLSFGWTRANEVNNGLYMLPIGLEEGADINAVKPRIDLGGIKDALKTTVKNFRGRNFDLSDIAKVVYENTQDILDASAIKATWEDADSVKHSVYSNYDIAATVMKPLSFQFEGFDLVKDKIARQMSKLRLNTIDPIAFNYDFDIQVRFDPLDPIAAPELYIIDPNDPTKTIPIENLDAFVDGLNLNFVTGVNERVNGLIAEIKAQAQAKVNELTSEVNGKVNSYIDKINNYTLKFNDYMGRLQNKVEGVDLSHFLQPCLLVDDGNIFGRVSHNKYIPTFVRKGESNAVILTPTTYTSELVAPAFYKFLAVTNVFNADGTQYDDYKNLISEINGTEYTNLNVPFQNKQQVVLPLPKTGLTYEIVYQAVDFSGVTVTDKYYIRYID